MQTVTTIGFDIAKSASRSTELMPLARYNPPPVEASPRVGVL